MSMFALLNREMLKKLVVFVGVMFVFGFALVPIYKKICEVTGVNDFMKPEQLKNSQVDFSRTVKIEFDANTRNLPWSFKPEFSTLTVHPGELTTVMYEVHNTTARDMVGQAIPSYGPSQAAEHFKKLECFCFAKQTFVAQETRYMPVVFVVDPSLPKDINTITLSYTFFEVPGAAVPPAAKTPVGKLEAQATLKLVPG